MKLKNTSRRKFLKDLNSLALSSGMVYGLDQLFNIMIGQSVAQASTESSYPYRYVNFVTSGGPPRWYFDQPLNPKNSSSTFIPGNFGTIIKNSGGKWATEHSVKSVKFGAENIFMPPVWSLKSAGTGVALSSLLQQTVMIRGLNMEINSHTVNRERTVRPFNSTPSITGLVGAYAQKPIPSMGHIGTSTTIAYKGTDGSTPVAVSFTNPIPNVTSPFNVNEIVKYDDLDYSIQRALTAIDTYAKVNKMSSSGNEQSLENTYKMFERNLSQFTKTFATLLDKYQKIVTQEIKADFPGITTDLKDIKPDGSKVFQYTSGQYLTAGDNIKSLLDASDAPRVAYAFAFAEFALKENLTSALSLDMGGNFGRFKNTTISHDQHFIGSVTSTILTSLYYRSVLGCMTEFKKSLEAVNLWQSTVVHMASEFSRTPRTDGAGSDHGFESGSTSIISGMIQKPGLVGDIYQTPPESMASQYAGTWGHAAPCITENSKKRNIINDDVVSTLCEMLQIPSIGTKGISLVKNSGGVVTLATSIKYNNVKRS